MLIISVLFFLTEAIAIVGGVYFGFGTLYPRYYISIRRDEEISVNKKLKK